MPLATPRSTAHHTASLLLTTHISPPPLRSINVTTPNIPLHLLASSQHTATDMAPHFTRNSNGTTQPPQPGDYMSLHYTSAPANGITTPSDLATTHVGGGPGIG
ncbi:hypothetical protein Pcinc_010632 [Petrolisthes cinctipes]|uniref:Uncharacterized protein n=1 Tax=Petrolisthes cinctipes TaxID=88211 RepID=A0AAE1G2F5_PETCI|nr:hypothetical protein Pcinc_010601 [Petrolisthes cinctipes]KAK3885151.1 hypothetical protein Pcinc_010632 [Petrolisthes cinctipes]